MARRRYKLQSSNSRGSGLYWILALLLVGGIVWVWLNSQQATPPKTIPAGPPKKPAATIPPHRTVQPVPQPPPPVTRQHTPPASPQPTPTPTPPPPAGVVPPGQFPRPPKTIFEAQLALDRLGISSGSIDGAIGSQTRAALRAFQQREKLPVTGELDAATRTRLLLTTPPITSYNVTSNDIARLQPIAATWLGKSQQSALDYETILELVAEKSHAHPGYIRTLNPGVNWSNIVAGVELRVPDATYPEPTEKAAFIRISLTAKTLQVFGADTFLLAHFPCSIAQRVEKRPVGELQIVTVAPNPNYTFNPEVFPESPEAQAIGRKLILPPGPNNPVGVAWITLDRPGYGIHGTPGPEQVGRTESHGCFRLANWNAEHLLKLVKVGTPVVVEE